MNSEGHLISPGHLSQEELRARGYEPVPEELEDAARLELMGKSETYVGLKSSGSLAKHARYLQKKAAQKAARRKNLCR